MLLLVLYVVVQAQFTYTTNNGVVAITVDTCAGSALIIPSTTNGPPATSIPSFAFY